MANEVLVQEAGGVLNMRVLESVVGRKELLSKQLGESVRPLNLLLSSAGQAEPSLKAVEECWRQEC